MSKAEFNELEAIRILGELNFLFKVNHNVLIPELDKLENIVKSKNYDNSNLDFGFAFRRVQEIGIYDEDIDELFKELNFIICVN
ncbi:hypothetical protein [Psychrobacter sp. NPDC078631]|uniref:hypothetical protein n=1 Tax=Psychrobacter sp. NPDC078631 TaxID=3390666 RepID=UPI003D01ECD4